jgi:hypothetical protein
MTYVVDVNVPVVSDGKSPQATKQCRLNCIVFLEKLINNNKIALDSRKKILSEYTHHLSTKKQPCVSSDFYKWVVDNYSNSLKCELVDIRINRQRGFDEFPDDKRLKRFHADDRKYIAVSIAHKEHPEVVQAVDKQWRQYEKILAAYKVKVIFLDK